MAHFGLAVTHLLSEDFLLNRGEMMFIEYVLLAFIYIHFKISAFCLSKQDLNPHLSAVVLLGGRVCLRASGLSQIRLKTKWYINQYKLKYELQCYIVLCYGLITHGIVCVCANNCIP